MGRKQKGNKIELTEDHAIIYASNTGDPILVDMQDVGKVTPYTWQRSKGYGYAVANSMDHSKRGGGRLLLHALLVKCPEGLRRDHVNGNGLDNRRANIRIATPSQNSQNQKRRSDNTSGFKGVSWAKDRKIWDATICVNGKNKRVGSFRTKEEAAAAYDKAATLYFGEFAKLNLPSE